MKKRLKRPSKVKTWVRGILTVMALAAGLFFLKSPLNKSTTPRTDSEKIELSQEEIDKRSHAAFLDRFNRWTERNAPQFISYLNTEAIKKQEYSERLGITRQENPFQLAFEPDKDNLETWQEQARSKFIELITGGQGFPEKVALDIKQEPLDELIYRLSKAPYRNYDLKQISYSTRTDRRLRAFLAKPKGIKPGQKLPAMLALPGHHGRPENIFMLDKSSIGGITNDAASYAYHYGHILANEGYIVLAPDTGGCPYMPDNDNYQAPPEGWLDDGARVWDCEISLDVLASFPEVDENRIGSYGHSLGGLESLYTAALDSRIKATVSAGIFGQYDAISACKCNIIPNLEKWLRVSDLTALYLPNRVLITEKGEHDKIASAIDEGKDARYLFDYFNRNNNFIQIQTTGHHVFYCGDETLKILHSVLKPDI